MPAPTPLDLILASLDALPSIGALAGRNTDRAAISSPGTVGTAGVLPAPVAVASPALNTTGSATTAPPDSARKGSWWGNAALDAMSPEERSRVWSSTLAGASQALAPLLVPSPVKPSIGAIMSAVGSGIALGREAGIERLEEQRSKRFYSDYLRQKAETERVEAGAKAAKEKREREAQALLLGTGSALLDDPNLTPNQKILLRYALMKGDTSPGDLGKILEPEAAMKAPTTREFRQGATVVTQEWDPTRREWKTVGQGPAWAPQQPRESEPLVEVYDPSSPTGTSMVPRSQGAGRPGAPPAGFEIAYDAQGRPVIRTGVRSGGKGGDAAPPSGYRWSDAERTRLEPIPGGPGEKASGDVAGRISMLPGALADLQGVRGAILDPQGGVNRTTLGTMNAPLIGAVPGTAGTGLRSRIEASIDTLVRMRTGASATQGEMERLAGIYMPNPSDPDAVVRDKLDRLERDLKNAEAELTRGTGSRGQDAAPAATPPGDFRADVDHTATVRGLTKDQVLEELAKRRGVPVESLRRQYEGQP